MQPNPMTSAFMRDRREDTERIGEGHVKTKAEMAAMQRLPRNAWCHQKLEAGKESPKPLEAAWPCPQLDTRLLPSGTMRENISIAFSHHVCGYLLHSLEQ